MTKNKHPVRTKSRLVIEVAPELKAWLERFCQEHGHSLTWVVAQLLEKYRKEKTK